MLTTKAINLYPKPAPYPTRTISVLSSAVAFTGDSAELVIGDETNFITFTSVAKNDAANNISIAYVQGATTTTEVSVSGQAITVALGYQALTASSLSTNLTGSNNDLTFTAVTAGADGDDISIEYVDPSANNAALSIDVTGDKITVNLATGSGGAITSTANQIKTALQADQDASALITVALKTGNTGAGVVTALTETNLSGGYDAEFVGTLDDIKDAIDGSTPASALVTCEIDGTDSTVASVVAAQNLSGGLEAFPLEASYVMLNVQEHDVYVTFDGSTPSSSNGVLLAHNYVQYWSSHAARAAKFIEKNSGATVVAVPFGD